jgi:predicted small integral membrane protein
MNPHVAPLRSSASHLPFLPHDSPSVFKNYSFVHHVLKTDKIMGLKSISETIIQSVEKLVLLLLVCIHVIRSIMG